MLAALDQDFEAGDVTARGPVATFARLCLQSLSGRQAGALGVFPPILKRLVTRSAILSPEKPQWLIEAEVVLHLSERMLGLSRWSASDSKAAPAIQVHRTRRRACGTYSTPNYIADHLCAAVFPELGQRSVGSQPLRVLDLSAEAGHFALAALAFPNRPSLEFFAFDRDPEAIALLRTIHDYAGPRNSGPAFRLDAQVADSIIGAPLSSHLGKTDAVIGNPPWKTMHPTDKKAYVERYSCFLRGRFDVYQAFLLRADEFLRPGGILAMAVPSSLLYTDNACEVRRYLKDRYHPISLRFIHAAHLSSFQASLQLFLFLRRESPASAGGENCGYLSTAL